MSGPDLTRWNRAGLTRFRYIDGNAVDFLERLRVSLVAKLPDWTDIVVAPGESAVDRFARMSQQYDTPRADWAWEIVRAFARVCHVLGEHVDAYANEGYLRTATQWDNVRKLVSMLDVHPAPPASASTPLVITAKDEPGTLAAGFAVRYTPKDGKPPVIFETLEDLAVDSAMNALHLLGWNLSPSPLIDLPATRPLSTLAQRSARIIQGVGTRYGALLDTLAPLGSGAFTVADFRTFSPTSAGGRAVLRLWEAKSKAEILFDFPWTAGELSSLGRKHLPELLAMTAAQLAAATGFTTTEMAQFLEDLRTVEVALDSDVFDAARLEELLLPGEAPPEPPPLWQAPEKSGISAGQLAVVVRANDDNEQGAVVRIGRVEAATGAITLESVAHQPAWENWTRGVSSLFAKPKVIAVAHISGSPGALTFVDPHGLSEGDRVAWQSTSGTWTFATVDEADELGLLLAGSAKPTAGTEVYRGIVVEGDTLPLDYRAAAKGNLQLVTTRTEVRDDGGRLRYYTVPAATRVIYIPGGAQAAGRVESVASASGDGTFRFSGKPGKLESGQWVVGDDDGRLLALRIERIEEFEEYFAVTFESVVEPTPEVAAMPPSILMGVGMKTLTLLNAQGLNNVGKLAAVGAHLPTGLPRATALELRAKAQLVTGFPFEERDLEPILDSMILQVLAMTNTALADELGKPSAWAAELLEKLRLLQAVVDEVDLAALRIRDLLPSGAPVPVVGYALQRLDRLYGAFEHTIRPSGWDVNDTPVSGARLPLELAPPSLLARGRKLVLERAGYAREASVSSVDAMTRTVDVTPALTSDEGFTLGNLVIAANVARGGHGETKPVKVLGSGDATKLSQTVVLKEKDVAFVTDASMPSGVAAAVTVTIAGQTWLQVAALRDSKPSDAHYEVRLTEDGYLQFTFGDGLHGRRLPTGTNNVRVAFRVGSGLAGNLAPGSLTKAARPNVRVASVAQPLDATGGNDREDITSLKEQAPKSVLTLERAVSLADFGALAARQSSVWQARAFALPTGGGRHASVEVVVVPAGGGPLGSLAADLETFLIANGLPGIDVTVSAYEAKPFDLEVDLEVKSAEFDPDEVRKNVETALFDTFSLKRRALGASLFTSEIYAVVENIAGVESSHVRASIGGVSGERVLRAEDRQVIFLDAAQSQVSVAVQEFEL